ncbi:MAG: GNAT family N-acetyltransferase [Rhizobiaceae bacterium]|nr:GNAT family N-acetyltransferase [Rhizobiaceae bacterium]
MIVGQVLLDFGDGFFLRQADAGDHAALCMVCLRTGDAGADATWREDDPTLMGHIYAVPYQVFASEYAFVVDGPQGVAGYLLGALDTAAFYHRLETDWYPVLQGRVFDPGPDRSNWKGSDWARHAVHHANLSVPEALAAYPSHGHIDLLPEARGRGIGRRSMHFLESRLAASGSTGLFLDVHPRNSKAQHFYAVLGYEHVASASSPTGSAFMAKQLAP